MPDERTPGVLIKGSDGAYYFIPESELVAHPHGTLPPTLEVGGDVDPDVPRLEAFAVELGGAAGGFHIGGGLPTGEFYPAPDGVPSGSSGQ